MLNLEKAHWAHIDRLTVLSTTEDPEEGIQCKTRIKLQMELDEGELDTLPVSPDAVKALLDESNGIDEGKNTVKLSFKRDLPLCNYTLSQSAGKKKKMSKITGFTGEVKNQPVVKIVQGVVFACWEVETVISQDQVASLSGFVGRDDLKIIGNLVQPELPLEVVA